MAQTHSTDNEFTYFIKILDDHDEQYYLKTTIDEENHTILIYLSNLKHGWVGTLNQEQVRVLAKKFPVESNDSFYSHTQRAFSKGNIADVDGRKYVFNCKKLDKNRLEFIWKEKIEALNSLKVIGTIELQERPNEEILTKIINYTIDEMDALRSSNEQKMIEIQCTQGQLNKALETVKRTVDLKEKLEADLYRKFVVVLNAKKTELLKLKRQLESCQSENKIAEYHNETYVDSHSRSPSPMQTIASDETQHSTNKRYRHEIDDVDTSNEEDNGEISTQLAKQAKLKSVPSDRNNPLDLGDDQMDYKPSTISKHYQRRRNITGENTISTRPFVNPANVSSTVPTPSLPDDSQSADDLLNKM